MDKERLRKKLRAQRQELTADEVRDLSRQIINNCWGIIDWPNIQSLHTYLPITKNSEVDTTRVIKAAWQLNPELKIATWSMDENPVKSRWLDEDLELTKVVPQEFQFGLIIVPLLGFDHRGNRLGYGGGFYDEFLTDQAHALTIGLCYEFGNLKSLPHEPHDIPIKIIVTEKQIYKF